MENLIVFAALVLVGSVAQVSNQITVAATVIYMWSRLAHYLIYVAGIPVLRTLSFLVGFGCQVAMAVQLLL